MFECTLHQALLCWVYTFPQTSLLLTIFQCTLRNSSGCFVPAVLFSQCTFHHGWLGCHQSVSVHLVTDAFCCQQSLIIHTVTWLFCHQESTLCHMPSVSPGICPPSHAFCLLHLVSTLHHVTSLSPGLYPLSHAFSLPRSLLSITCLLSHEESTLMLLWGLHQESRFSFSALKLFLSLFFSGSTRVWFQSA